MDVDGTLVDTNYHHAIAWYRAFRQHGELLPIWRIHRHIGMGGDHLVKALYMALIEEVEPLEGARELIPELKDRGHAVVLASSAKPDEVEHYLDLLEAREIADGWTTSGDVRATKPEPDLVKAAIEKVGADDAVMVGDSTWDCEAAGRAGIATVAVLTGGFSEAELRDAGALALYHSIVELRNSLDEWLTS
jgi:HAD superfamily hydrolase (TIGR01509 family)